MNRKGLFFKIIAAALVIGAAVSAIIIFKDEILDFFYNIKARCEELRIKGKNLDEFSDYADV